MWDFKNLDLTWAAAGYSGAIGSGNTTCGLLIGSSIAIGFRHGQGKECIPMKSPGLRDRATKEVNDLYRDFQNAFGDTVCRNLVSLDFSKPEEKKRYATQEVYKNTCFLFFEFVINRFIEMDKKGL